MLTLILGILLVVVSLQLWRVTRERNTIWEEAFDTGMTVGFMADRDAIDPLDFGYNLLIEDEDDDTPWHHSPVYPGDVL